MTTCCPDLGQSGGIAERGRPGVSWPSRGVELAPTGMEQMGIELQNLYAALWPSPRRD
ncbi:MAG: hypothetical protein ACLSHO_08685 [Dysosmobacter sp.]